MSVENIESEMWRDKWMENMAKKIKKNIQNTVKTSNPCINGFLEEEGIKNRTNAIFKIMPQSFAKLKFKMCYKPQTS